MRLPELAIGLGLIILAIFAIPLATTSANATLTIPTWATTYHATAAAETANSARQTTDGGYIVAGSTNSSGIYHAWLLKLDSLGNVVWQKTYGGVGPDSASSVQQTTDGGYVVAGELTNSSSGNPYTLAWVLKLDATGNIVWQRTYPGSSGISIKSIYETSDGGFILLGSGNISCLFCFSGAYGEWVVKLTAIGDITWQKVYSWGITSVANSLLQTSDGGFVVAASAKECCFGNSDNWDALIFKLNATGGIVWQKTYGGPDYEQAASFRLTSDGGFIVAGVTDSFGDQSHCFPGPGVNCEPHDWVFKLNSTGGVVWQRTYGGTGFREQANSVDQTTDGGFVVVGSTDSPGGAWIYKLDPAGNILWQSGGPSTANGLVQRTTDGGIVTAGYASGTGLSVVKLDAYGDISSGCNLVASANFTATSTNATTTMPSLVVNTTLATVAASNATASVSSAGTSVQCSGTGTGIGSSSTRTTVYDTATGAAWSGTETTGASAYDTAGVTVPGPAVAKGTVTYTFYTNNACAGQGSPAGTVSLTSTGVVPNSNAEGPLTYGSYSFQAFYSGDSNYNNSTSPCEPFTVLKPDFTMSANPSSLIVRLGGSNTTTITLNSINGFSGTVTLTTSISPLTKQGPFLTLSSTMANVAPGAPATVVLTVTSKGATAVGSYTATVTGSSGSLSHTTTITVQIVKKK
jgi:hypothetical protein